MALILKRFGQLVQYGDSGRRLKASLPVSPFTSIDKGAR